MVRVQLLLSSDVTESVSTSSLLQAASWNVPSARATERVMDLMLRMCRDPRGEVGAESTCERHAIAFYFSGIPIVCDFSHLKVRGRIRMDSWPMTTLPSRGKEVGRGVRVA